MQIVYVISNNNHYINVYQYQLNKRFSFSYYKEIQSEKNKWTNHQDSRIKL